MVVYVDTKEDNERTWCRDEAHGRVVGGDVLRICMVWEKMKFGDGSMTCRSGFPCPRRIQLAHRVMELFFEIMI